MNILGLAVGRNTHTLVYDPSILEGSLGQEMIPNSSEGMKRIVELYPRMILVVGNREWGKAFMYAVHAECESIDIRYVPRPSKKGAKDNMAKFLTNVLSSGIMGKSFFQERKPDPKNGEDASEEHPWYRLSQEYNTATDEVRRARHLVLSTLSILFPEAVKPGQIDLKKGRPVPQPIPPGVWTKGMRRVLENPDPFFLEDEAMVRSTVRELAKKSLGKHIPREKRDHYLTLHLEYLTNLDKWLRVQEETLGRLREAISGHPIMQIDPDSVTLAVLCGYIGWRSWPSWRELQAFTGLLVSRVDEKGRPRIGRQRKMIRNYLYLMLGTKWGKEIVAAKDGVPIDPPLKTKVKRIEGLLGGLRRMYLSQELNAA